MCAWKWTVTCDAVVLCHVAVVLVLIWYVQDRGAVGCSQFKALAWVTVAQAQIILDSDQQGMWPHLRSNAKTQLCRHMLRTGLCAGIAHDTRLGSMCSSWCGMQRCAVSPADIGVEHAPMQHQL